MKASFFLKKKELFSVLNQHNNKLKKTTKKIYKKDETK